MSHSYVSLKYHVIFSTRYRLPWITPELEPQLYDFMGGVLRRRRGVLLEVGGVEDHVHALMALSQDTAIASLVGALKANSSSFAKEAGDNPDFAWQRGYAAFTVSESQAPRVRRYIQRQKIHHRTVSYEDEVRGLARRSGLELEASFFSTGRSLQPPHAPPQATPVSPPQAGDPG